MVLQERLYDIDDVWELVQQPENGNKHFELIDGVLIEMSPPGGQHGQIAGRLAHYIIAFVDVLQLGVVTVETGYHPPQNRRALLSPDVAFVSEARAPQPFPVKYVALMPDLAIEIVSPSNSYKQIRRKAEIYLQNGTQLVWIIMPAKHSVEVSRAVGGGGLKREKLSLTDTLTGDEILPGFELELSRLFA